MELVVGRVARAHGVTGEVVVDVRTDEPYERFAVGRPLRARPGRRTASRQVTPAASRTFAVESVREHGGRLLLRLAGIADRDAADALRGTLFVVDSEDLPPIAADDEFYDHQLEGLAVDTVTGQRVGAVAEVLHTAAGELLSVRTDAGREVLIPFVAAIVVAVDLAAETVRIDPPDGLLELN